MKRETEENIFTEKLILWGLKTLFFAKWKKSRRCIYIDMDRYIDISYIYKCVYYVCEKVRIVYKNSSLAVVMCVDERGAITMQFSVAN